jgi:hypothetical protein
VTDLAYQADGLNTQPSIVRTRLIRAGWVVIRRSDGLRNSIPVFHRRVVALIGLDTPVGRGSA